jgi:hypothetical protein
MSESAALPPDPLSGSTLVAYWSYGYDMPDHLGGGFVTGELLLRADGVLLRRQTLLVTTDATLLCPDVAIPLPHHEVECTFEQLQFVVKFLVFCQELRLGTRPSPHSLCNLPYPHVRLEVDSYCYLPIRSEEIVPLLIL